MIKTLISIVIPTYKRIDALNVALSSVEHENVAGFEIEIIIADNDPKASAKDFTQDFIKKSPANIRYIHIPQPGVSNARNGALKAAKGRYIAFLDDDMEAVSPWLASLIKARQDYDAAVIFGPVEAVMPPDGKAEYVYMQPEFSRPQQADGLVDYGFGTGNSLIDRMACILPDPPFDTTLNQTGGEDDVLFHNLQSQGVKFAWASQALSREHVPARRATLSYIWKRNFAFGQGPSQDAADRGLKGIFGVARWMLVGLYQALIYGLKWLWFWLTGQPRHVEYFCRLAQGLGKTFWFPPFTVKLYGGI